MSVHDYRGMQGQVFYASPSQPEVPQAVRDTRERPRAHPRVHPAPRKHAMVVSARRAEAGLDAECPADGRTTRARLRRQGFTGKGQTIVFYEFHGYDQTDLDEFAKQSGLPPLKPILIGGHAGRIPRRETVMDLEVAHAVAPDAQMVVVNARPTLEGGRTYERIAEMFDSVDRQFPGAVWSLSIGWGCDALITATDLKPVQAALQRAQAHGTTAFDASGDTAGLECKGGPNWSAPPGPDDVGLDAVASLARDDLGRRHHIVDRRRRRMASRSRPGSTRRCRRAPAGGVHAVPPPSLAVAGVLDARPRLESRLTPDVAAVADPITGVRIRFDGQDLVGAGTSQAAPIWAALTAVMNQYLLANGGRALGDINPLLYRVAAGANAPGFRDVSLGANAVDVATPGYDLVTGLGTPNVDGLVHDFLDIQRGVAPR